MVAAMADGTVAYIYSGVQTAEPYHGASRVMMTIGSPAPLPETPAAPRGVARAKGGVIVFEWTAPAQIVNGYRVESRIDDGPWIEIEEWLSPDRRSVSVPARSSTTYAFRVRAWNDAGAGAYSDPVIVQRPRRRAVR